MKRWLKKWLKKEEKAKNDWSAYALRNKVLQDLGFSSYDEYLASPLWEEVRNKRLSMSDSCSCCVKPATVVHHSAYHRKVMIGEERAIRMDLHPLCWSCHRWVEFDGDRKRSSGEADRVLRRMLFKFRNGASKGQIIRQAIRDRTGG